MAIIKIVAAVAVTLAIVLTVMTFVKKRFAEPGYEYRERGPKRP